MTRVAQCRFWLLVALSLSCSATAFSATLQWRGGGADLWIDPTQAPACTLIVTRDPAIASCDGFRTIWSGNGRLRFASVVGVSRVPYSASTTASLKDRADAVSGRETLDMGLAKSSRSLQLIVTILSGNAFEITMVEVKDGRALRWPLSRQPTVRINGGLGRPLRPEVISATPAVKADSVSYWVTGLGLSLADHVYLSGAGAPSALPFAVFGDTALSVGCSIAEARVGWMLRVTTDAGVGSGIEADVRQLLPAAGPSQILAILLEGAPTTALSTVEGVSAMAPIDPTPASFHPKDASDREDFSRILVVNVAPGQDPAVVLARIRANPAVVAADLVVEGPGLLAEPNDPLWTEQWGLHDVTGMHCNGTIQPAPSSSINLPQAWDYPPLPAPVRIAIVDTGIELDHPDLRNLYDPSFPGKSFAPGDTNQWVDYENHGTAVASIAAGSTNNFLGLAGASQLGIPVSVKWMSSSLSATWPAMTAAILFAANSGSGTPIINVSAGGKHISGAERTALTRACKAAFQNDRLLVCAAGDSHDSVLVFPASLDEYATAVGATLWNNLYWTSANAWYASEDSMTGSPLGSWVDVVAPGGVGITAAWSSASNYYWDLDLVHLNACDLHYIDLGPSTGRSAFGGTSAAAPLVAGTAAWLKQIQPTLTAEDLGQILRRTATDMGAAGFDVLFGHGRIDAGRAAGLVSSPNWIEHGTVGAGGTGTLSVADSVINSTITITNATNLGIPNGTYPCVRYHLAGGAPFSASFTQVPTVWIRRKDTRGLAAAVSWDNDLQPNWAGAISPTTAQVGSFETYVYRLTGSNVFVPCSPEQARVTYTAIAPVGGLAVATNRPAQHLSVRTRLAPAYSQAIFDASGLVAGPLRVEVFDITGRRVATLFEGASAGGRAAFQWNGRSVGSACSAGMYICRVEQPSSRMACRFAFIR